MYEEVKNFLVEKGFKKHKASSFLCVKNDMLFTVSPQGRKNDINIWFGIYPLSLPELWISMGWGPAAGSFPKNGCIPYNPEKVDEVMIEEFERSVFPFFQQCESLHNLEILYSQGNSKAQYPRVFALYSLGRYAEAHELACKVIEEFRDGGLGINEIGELKKFTLLQSPEIIDAALKEERAKNVKKYSLARHIKKC